MITNKSFTKEWIESFRKQADYRKIDPALLEKMIHALSLVEKLAQHDFGFIFKGGTCLILLLSKPSRFSVDVDITTPIEKAQSASARTAYLASKLLNNDFSNLKVYEPDIDLADHEIKNQDFNFINRFKKTNREAFYYWYQCLSVTGQLQG